MRIYLVKLLILVATFSLLSSSKAYKPMKATPQSYLKVYKLNETVRKEPHIQIVVSLPGKAVKQDGVFVDIFNRTNEELTGIDFNIELLNQKSVELTADMRSEPMGKNAKWSSGGQEFKMPKNVDKGKLPPIKGAIIHRLSVYDAKGTERNDFKVYFDLSRS